MTKGRKPTGPPAKAAKTPKQVTARKAAPAQKAKPMEPRTALPVQRSAPRVQPQAKVREQEPPAPTAQPVLEHEGEIQQHVVLPAPTFDPTR